MAYDVGRQALQREIELLKILQQATDSFRTTVANEPIATFIAKDWLGSFDKLQKLNAALIADNDKDFEHTLTGEKELLNGFLGVAGSIGFAKSWEELFQNDIQIVDLLLKE